MNIPLIDAKKIADILLANEKFHEHRDRMNSALHLAAETRFSPLTSETMSARERLEYFIRQEET